MLKSDIVKWPRLSFFWNNTWFGDCIFKARITVTFGGVYEHRRNANVMLLSHWSSSDLVVLICYRCLCGHLIGRKYYCYKGWYQLAFLWRSLYYNHWYSPGAGPKPYSNWAFKFSSERTISKVQLLKNC